MPSPTRARSARTPPPRRRRTASAEAKSSPGKSSPIKSSQVKPAPVKSDVKPAAGGPAEVKPAQPKPAEVRTNENRLDGDGDGAGPLAPPRPAPRRPGLIPTDIADALSGVLGKSTRAIREHEAGSRKGGDLENVHQMRVATRRIRAYLKAVRPVLDPAAADGLRVDLADLARALGVVRDLDVMIAQLHSEAAALGAPDTAALETLIGSLDAERTRARKLLVAQLDDPNYQALLADLDQAVAKPPVADPWADLMDLGAAEFGKLVRGHRRLIKMFGGDPPDDDLHALRILGKRARYAAELQQKSESMTTFLQALAALQEVLGDHQDASVLEDQLRVMVAASGDPAAAIAAGRVIEGGRRRKIAARAAYPAAWAAVSAAAKVAYSG